MPLKAEDVLLVFALEAEAQDQFMEFPKLFCGIGKVNAATGLAMALAERKYAQGHYPRVVVNLGSAGSSLLPRGHLINCTGFVERDMDVTALGLPPYVTKHETPAVLRYGLRAPDYVEAVCGSGDSFVAENPALAHTRPWQIVDMEAYALAKICQRQQVSFGCVKYVTDGADETAAVSWETALADAAQKLRQALDRIMAQEVAACA